VDRLPFSYRYLPEMDMARGRIQDMLEKKQHTRQLSVQEKEHKNELLMYLAHDLKTPLTSMIGYINHILDHKVDQEQLDTSIRITYEKAQRLDDLIDEFSEILRYDDKVSQLEVTRIDLNTMLQQQLAGFYPLMEEKGIRLQLHLADHMEISGDFDKLQRVFDNLMRNAINYSIPQTEIRIAGMLYEDGVCLTYSNEGEAMDAASVQHLFDKFYRAGSARTSTSGGAGLGLAIAREIIELHQGEIKADMEGTTITFTLRLPYEQKVIL
jgi:two-component system sensor histidine kinase VanS